MGPLQEKTPSLSGPLAKLPALPDPSLEQGTLYECDDVAATFYLSSDASGQQVWRASAGYELRDFVQYVAPVTGKNTNDGLTKATPIKNLFGLKPRLPAFVGGQSRAFVIEPGTLVMPPTGIILPQPVNPQDTSSGAGESLVIDTRQALVTVETGRVVTADDPFGGTISYGGAALPRDTWIKMTAGAAAGLYGVIRNTTPGAPNVSVMFNGFFPAGTITGDTFDVVAPGCVIDASAGGFWFGEPGFKSVFTIIAAKLVGGYGSGVRGGAVWNTPACVFDTQGGGVTVAERGGTWGAGMPPDLDDGSLRLVPVITGGLDGGGAGGSLNANVNSEIQFVPLQATNTLIYAERGCSITLIISSLVNSPVENVQPAFTWVNGGFAPFPGYDGDATGLTAGFNWNPDSESNPGSHTAAIRISGGGGTGDPDGGNNSVSLIRI